MYTACLETPPLVRRELLTEQTAQGIRDAILNGTYSLGQKLRESELTVRFGVSSSVIREAFHVLQGEGIIVTRPYCGRSVFSLRPEEGAELLTMRASFESYAAYLAASKMTARKAETIRATAARFVSDTPAAYGDWVGREIAFHRAVWEASENDWLLRQLSQFTLPIFALRILGDPMKESTVQRHWEWYQVRETAGNPDGHQLLAETIASGQASEARRVMLRHILQEPNETQKELFGLT
jgi:DNA-binding GntR family transcriptional regulator